MFSYKISRTILASSVIGLTLLALSPLAFAGEKVVLCHYTESEKNPYVIVEVSVNALETMLSKGAAYYDETTSTCTIEDDGGGNPVEN